MIYLFLYYHFSYYNKIKHIYKYCYIILYNRDFDFLIKNSQQQNNTVLLLAYGNLPVNPYILS